MASEITVNMEDCSNLKIRSKKITLVDVAAAAGVSAITASRVINQPDAVSDELREQVERAIAELGYIHNQQASALASARSKLVGVAIPSLTNTVFTDVLEGIHDVLGSAGYKVLLVDTHYSSVQEERLVRTLLGQSLAGLIITGGDQTPECEQVIRRAQIPVVQVMDLLSQPIDMNVGFSHWQAGYDVAAHFIEEGYGHIGFIGARMDPRAQQRFQGFKQALEDAGKYWKNFFVIAEESSSIAVGGKMLHRLVSENNGVVDAVFCANDDLALGALFEAQRMQIDIPNDLAVCGFNDIEAAQYVNPSLTSVYVGRYEMGVKAAEMVLDKLSGKKIPSMQVDIGYQINKRQSTHY